MSEAEPSGYHRKKQPERVREAILREAGALASELGVQLVTLQAVANRAGVTKGGLIHHFPDREALISALRAQALSSFEATLTQNLTEPEGIEGRFTRAYVKTCLAPMDEVMQRLVAALWADPILRRDWYLWLEAQEQRHAATDAGPRYKLARLAADGAWLAMTDGADSRPWLDELLARI